MIRIMTVGETPMSEIFLRGLSGADVSGTVAGILADVKQNGDRALFAYAEKFDHARLDSLEVSAAEIDEALAATESAFLDILRRAADNIPPTVSPARGPSS